MIFMKQSLRGIHLLQTCTMLVVSGLVETIKGYTKIEKLHPVRLGP